MPSDGHLIVRELNDKEPRQSFPIGTGEIAISGTIGSLWRVELAARDWWMDPATVTIPASATTIVRPIYRAATLSGRLAGVASEKLPQSLKIVVEAPPWAPRALANGVEFHCSVAPAGAWTCPVPATPLDVAIIASGYVPEYRWNVNAEPGSTVDAGTIRLREGGSATAWVSPVRDSQRGPEAVRALLRRVMPPASSPQTQRLAAPVAEAAVAANGFVQLAPVPPGRYMLVVSAEGFATCRICPSDIFEDRETTLRRPIELNRPVPVAIHV
ncbi:MAG TPA: hypothetical protein VE010_20745, partial [Thermoanaerobaculia bacterium]|nr:hypothetical protein [Thermoanaerobaculia bacterium]